MNVVPLSDGVRYISRVGGDDIRKRRFPTRCLVPANVSNYNSIRLLRWGQVCDYQRNRTLRLTFPSAFRRFYRAKGRAVPPACILPSRIWKTSFVPAKWRRSIVGGRSFEMSRLRCAEYRHAAIQHLAECKGDVASGHPIFDTARRDSRCIASRSNISVMMYEWDTVHTEAVLRKLFA